MYFVRVSLNSPIVTSYCRTKAAVSVVNGWQCNESNGYYTAGAYPDVHSWGRHYIGWP